ncbi:MAG: branched-chain amino acid ABC transporter substrate-binding protein [Chloroflexota bacterium]
MRNRSFALNTLEVIVPVVLAVVLGVGTFLLLTPLFGQAKSAQSGVIRIYSSVPMPGYDSIVHGIQMALVENNSQAGSFRIEYVPLNDALVDKDGNSKWNPDVELANARRAVEDPDAMIYIGTYNSGAAKISIPVLNRVSLAMISPGNTYPGLTKPGTGNAGEPWTFYPLGIRNYFRVVPADDLQGAAAAAYAKQLGKQSVYVLDDTEVYGKGIATIFARSAGELGLKVLGGPESIDVRAQDYSALASKIIDLNPDLVYFGGIVANHPNLVLRDLRRAGYTGAFMGADDIAGGSFIQSATDAGIDINQGEIYASLVGLPASKLTGAGASWYQRYKQQYPDDAAPDFAPFGYEAAKVALSAIERAGNKNREAIRQAVAATGTDQISGDHILGDWKFDANGDTSLVTISVQRVGQSPESGRAEWLYQGIMSYNPETKAWTFLNQ